MTSAKKSALAAVALFVLIAAVVLGGMTWATISSYELAKKNVAEEHVNLVDSARLRIESHVQGILNSEASRPYADYLDEHAVRPGFVVTRDRRELEAMYAVVASPVAESKPRYDWVELYFQVDEDRRLSSPQLTAEDERRGMVSAGAEPWQRRAAETWAWFHRMYSGIDFHGRVSEALCGEDVLPARPGVEPKELVALRQEASDKRGFRRSSVAESQKGYLPPEDCVSEQIVKAAIRGLPLTIEGEAEETSSPLSTVQIGPFAPPFWVEAGPQRGLKLAFVRECRVDADVIYQGFVADWERLKPELLKLISVPFPDADLRPVPNDVRLDDEVSAMKLHALPVVLDVPDIPGGTSAAAWRSVRGVLVISWTAAVAVLVVAGWGVRNLVALTERRLQFAYAVTHELRTPLTTFRLYSDMLSAGLVPDPSKQEYLDTLNRESQRLSSLVESVLEYARLENQKVKLHVTQTDAASLMRAVGETVQRRCEKNDVQGATSSKIAAEHRLSTDVNLVNQIAAVLVDNACRHARSSTEPKVKVELGADNGRLHLDVVDSGPGVDLADSRRIFRPFRRGKDADASARGGIGLGLALARNWASLLGGRLDLVARHDPQLGGAHFRLSIPAHHKVT